MAASILVIAIIFVDVQLQALLVALLFLPFLDRQWRLPDFQADKRNMAVSLIMVLSIVALLVLRPESAQFVLITLLFVALPEEWFYRGYLLGRIQSIKDGYALPANIWSSIAFSLLHAVTRGPEIALQVFVPSLVFGWLYQKTNDLVICILVHTLSNLVYVLFVRDRLALTFGI